MQPCSVPARHPNLGRLNSAAGCLSNRPHYNLLAPHRVGRPEQRAHGGTISTTAVDAIWGTDMTETVTLHEGRARLFVYQ